MTTDRIINDDDFELCMKRIIDEQNNYIKELIEFANSEKKEQVMSLIAEYIKNNKFIDDEDIAYFPHKFSFSNEEFGLLFSLVVKFSRENNKEIVVSEFSDHRYYILYDNKKYLFRKISGQGTCYQIFSFDAFDFENEIDEKYIINFNDVIYE